MVEKFQNKYKVSSTRLPKWNYANNEFYFITICTEDRKHYFGEVKNGQIFLNDAGNIANHFLFEIPRHFPFVDLDAFVVMPNHIHVILTIDNDFISGSNDEYKLFPDWLVAIQKPIVETGRCPVSTNAPKINRFRNQGKNTISSIIGSYKSACSKLIHTTTDKNFTWQERFWDHLIKDEISLYKIRNYVLDNPYQWERDKNNPSGLWY